MSHGPRGIVLRAGDSLVITQASASSGSTPQWYVTYYDMLPAEIGLRDYPPTTINGGTDDTNTVTMLSGPDSSVAGQAAVRIVTGMGVVNRSSAAEIFTFRYNGGTERDLLTQTLNTGQSVHYTPESAWTLAGP